jgi:hypothetical protein
MAPSRRNATGRFCGARNVALPRDEVHHEGAVGIDHKRPAGVAGRLIEGDESIDMEGRERGQNEARAFAKLSKNLFHQLVFCNAAITPGAGENRGKPGKIYVRRICMTNG